jgi:hypothetical protein
MWTFGAGTVRVGCRQLVDGGPKSLQERRLRDRRDHPGTPPTVDTGGNAHTLRNGREIALPDAHNGGRMADGDRVGPRSPRRFVHWCFVLPGRTRVGATSGSSESSQASVKESRRQQSQRSSGKPTGSLYAQP